MKYLITILLLLSPAFGQHKYVTNFPANETPISENHNWINQGTCSDPTLCPGAGSSNVNSNSGIAHGTQSGAAAPPYLDSGAIVSGAWGATQTVEVVVNWDGNKNTDNNFDETEIRLRNTFYSNGHGQGYNVNCRTGTPSSGSYVHMGRFNADGSFGPLSGPKTDCTNSARCGCTQGDVLVGTIVNNSSNQPVVTFYKNGVQIIQGTDTGGPAAIQSGSPGFGFYHECGSHPCGSRNGSNSDFGISSFVASELAPPSGLSATVH